MWLYARNCLCINHSKPVGKNNRYGHQNKEVLENLEDSNIYRTDQDGSVMFKIKNNKLKLRHVVRRKEDDKMNEIKEYTEKDNELMMK